MKKKNIIFTLIYFFLIIFIILLVEIILRILNYGINTNIFIKAKYIPYYVENPYFINKYHPGFIKEAYSDERTIFNVKKDKNEIRCFVIGGSTAQGWPYDSNHSFGKISEVFINKLLEGPFQKKERVNVYNVSYSAMSSYFIRDAAIKLLKYKPDFLIIYAGHNEYYGTFGYGSRGNYWTKNLYLRLKEFKIFQLLINILKIEKPLVDKNNKNLMAQLFANKTFEYDEKRDKSIASDFIKNIDYVVKKYNRYKIPVIFVSPISNLISMPPFKGKDDDKYKDLIYNYLSVINKRDKEGILKFYKETEGIKDNANILYLRAMSELVLKLKEDKDILLSFINAKDRDLIPFRARNILVDKLREYANSKKYYNFYFIDLEKEYFESAGLMGFTNNYFVDHLHFNFDGQFFLSYFIVKKFFEIHSYRDFGNLIEAYNSADIKKLKKFIFFTDLNELYVESTISSLTKKPPYDKMLISYSSPSLISSDNELLKDKELIETLNKERDWKNVFGIVVNYYLDKKEYNKAIEYVNSFIFSYPGKYEGYYKRAQIYELIGEIEQAKEDYKIAYLLSGKKKELKNKFVD